MSHEGSSPSDESVCGEVLGSKPLEFRSYEENQPKLEFMIITILFLFVYKRRDHFHKQFLLFWISYDTMHHTDSDADCLPPATAAEFNCRTVRCSL